MTEKEQKEMDAQRINKLLNRIPPAFFVEEDFNPFHHWNDSVEELDGAFTDISTCISMIAESQYKNFHAATSAFASVFNLFHNTQLNVRQFQENLANSQHLLTHQAKQIKELYVQSTSSNYAITLCKDIEWLFQLSQFYPLLISRKQYMAATCTIIRAFSMVFESDLRSIGSLAVLREEIIGRRNALKATIIDEIQAVIYMTTSAISPSSLIPSTSSSAPATATSWDQATLDGTDASSLNSNPSSKVSQSASLSAFLEPVLESMSKDETVHTLLIEETNENYLSSPFKPLLRFFSITIASLGLLHALPSVRPQLMKNVKMHISQAIEQENTIAAERISKNNQRRILSKKFGKEKMRSSNSNFPGSDQIPTAEETECLLEWLDRLFHFFTRILKSYGEFISAINVYNEPSSSATKLQALPESPTKKAASTTESKEELHDVLKMWEAIQIQIQILLCDLLQTGNNPTAALAAPANLRKKKTKQAQKTTEKFELTFSFADSNLPSISKWKGGKSRQDTEQNKDDRSDLVNSASKSNDTEVTAPSKLILKWIKPTPYLVLIFYRPLIQFCDLAVSIMSPYTKSSSSHSDSSPFPMKTPLPTRTASSTSTPLDNQLRAFVHLFAESIFVPRLEADINTYIDDIFLDPSAFEARDRPILATLASSESLYKESNSSFLDPFNRSIFEKQTFQSLSSAPTCLCIIAISNVCSMIFSQMLYLPAHVQDLLSLIERIIDKLIDKSMEKFNEWTRHTFSAQRCADPVLQNAFHNDPFYIAFTQNTQPPRNMVIKDSRDVQSNSGLLQWCTGRNPIFTPFLSSSLNLHSSLLLLSHMGVQACGQVASLCENIETLCNFLYRYTDPFMIANTIQSPSPVYGASAPASTTSSASFPTFRSVHAKMSVNGTNSASKSSLSPLESKIYSICENLLQFADRLLLFLRCEWHAHLFYYLSQQRTSSYHPSTVSLEPESFILDLNKDTVQLDDYFSRYLSPEKRKLIYAGGCAFSSKLLVALVGEWEDENVNERGVAQLVRNAMALQQNLHHLGLSDEKALERARHYYESMKLSPEDLQELVADKSYHYTREELTVLSKRKCKTK